MAPSPAGQTRRPSWPRTCRGPRVALCATGDAAGSKAVKMAAAWPSLGTAPPAGASSLPGSATPRPPRTPPSPRPVARRLAR
eukprot:11194483-Lingulodinium_polyedra.AAC.1